MSITRQLIKHVRDLAEEQPDYVYARLDGGGCAYQEDGAPSCIIGQAAARSGVSVVELQQWDSMPMSSANVVLGGIGVQGAAKDWLRNVQATQDGGVSWGEAVAGADDCVVLFNEWGYL